MQDCKQEVEKASLIENGGKSTKHVKSPSIYFICIG